MKQFLLAFSIVFSLVLISCSNGAKQSNETADQEEETFTCLCCEPVLEESVDSIQ